MMGGSIAPVARSVQHGVMNVAQNAPVRRAKSYGYGRADSDMLLPAMGVNNELRILLVEDDADSREALCRLLKAQGHRVHPASDFGAALDVVAREAIDLVVSDIGLPGKDGCELMRAIKRLYDLPGIALTAYVSEEDEARCLEAGFAHYLDKPVKFSDVLKAVSTFARRADQPTTA
jgi:CheY-like chemotaxis protein